MMKKLITSLLMSVGIVSCAFAGTNSVFNAKEFGVSLSSSYVVDTAKGFQDDYNFNLEAGVHYFPTRLLGFEASVPFYSTEGVSVDRVSAGLLFRVPVGRFAPYVGAGTRYAWHDDSQWVGVAKVGLEYRFNPKWGVYSEGVYVNDSFSNWGDGEVSVRGGLKLNF